MDLFGDGGAADDTAPLEHQRPEAGLREVARGDEAVVPAADDDDVAAGRSRRAHARTLPLRQSESSLRAALRPGAPMMPPPGCVAEPHM